MRPVRLLVAAAWLIGCRDAAGPRLPASLPPGGIHVLFVGNSLTAANDLPGTVEAMGRSVGDTIRSLEMTMSNYALIDHLDQGLVQQVLARDSFAFVVLQQGPSTVPVNRDSLVLWTKMFAPLVAAAGARPALFMVWPDTTRLAFFDDCRLSYQLAAQAVNGVFMPAGEGWRAAWASDSTLALYGPDGYHPSPLGTYVAALVIYERLTGHDARALPPVAVVAGATLALPEATVRLLQAAAHTANSTYPP